jgi:hypothetical protein
MNLQELNEWMKSHKCVDTTDFDIDGCDNRYYSKIYEVNGQFFKVDFCNKYPSEKWGEKGYVRGVYEPKPVRLASWMEYRSEWISDKDEE